MIKIVPSSDITRFKPGELFEGEVIWDFEEAPDSLILEIGWITSGKGTVDSVIAHSKSIKVLNKVDKEYFNFIMPMSPYSFMGKLTELNWFIQINTLNKEKLASKVITLGPNRNKVIINQPKRINKLSFFDLSISK